MSEKSTALRRITRRDADIAEIGRHYAVSNNAAAILWAVARAWGKDPYFRPGDSIPWAAKSREDWYRECNLTRHRWDTVAAQLEALGLVERARGLRGVTVALVRPGAVIRPQEAQ